MKKPFLNALAAALYIIVIVLMLSVTNSVLKTDETIIIPMTMLALFVLSAAVMGFLFLSEPLSLLMENRKQEAIAFFGKTAGFFACFVFLFAIVLLIVSNPVWR